MSRGGIVSICLAVFASSASLADSRHYHQPSDDMLQPFNWTAAARFARINAYVVRAIADDPQRPRWYRNSFFGDTFAPDAPKAPR